VNCIIRQLSLILQLACKKTGKRLILKGIFSSVLAPIDLMRGSSFGHNNIAIESSYLRLELEILIIIY
jgi:hypothetical protein